MGIEITLFEQMARNNIRNIQQLHEKTGLSRNLISRMLNGEQKNFRLDTIVILCNALHCDIADLVSLKEKEAV